MVVFLPMLLLEMLQKQPKLEGLNAARDLYNSISPANKPGGVIKVQENLGIN
jgi:hypothetical protein